MNKIKQILKSKFRTGLKTIPYIIIAVLVGITAVYASSTTSLTPSGSASNTMYSLTDIYNLASGTVVSENTGAIEATPSEVALSGKSLSDVYTALSTEIAKLSPSVIKSGTTAFGITGAGVISLGDAVNTNVLAGKHFSNTTTANILGIMTNNTGHADFNPTITSVSIPTGFYDGATKINGDADLTNDNIKEGINIFGVIGNLTSGIDTGDATATEGDILATKTGYVNGIKITGNIATQTMSPANDTVPAGYYNATTLHAIDADLVIGNIKKNTVIFGITGNYEGTAPATLTWQTDPALSLCWSHNDYEMNSGFCTVNSGFIRTPDTLTTLGAVEYCKYLNADGTALANEQGIWHLPTIQEYTSITDYTQSYSATTVADDFVEGSYYWSSTQSHAYTDSAWSWLTDVGATFNDSKEFKNSVRCVH